jgi:hypothetical protein
MKVILKKEVLAGAIISGIIFSICFSLLVKVNEFRPGDAHRQPSRPASKRAYQSAIR